MTSQGRIYDFLERGDFSKVSKNLSPFTILVNWFTELFEINTNTSFIPIFSPGQLKKQVKTPFLHFWFLKHYKDPVFAKTSAAQAKF